MALINYRFQAEIRKSGFKSLYYISGVATLFISPVRFRI